VSIRLKSEITNGFYPTTNVIEILSLGLLVTSINVIQEIPGFVNQRLIYKSGGSSSLAKKEEEKNKIIISTTLYAINGNIINKNYSPVEILNSESYVDINLIYLMNKKDKLNVISTLLSKKQKINNIKVEINKLIKPN
jgi:hypothetical protein